MSILTNWGYTLVDDDSLFDMMDYAEYCTYSGEATARNESKRKSPPRVRPSVIMSAGICIPLPPAVLKCSQATAV